MLKGDGGNGSGDFRKNKIGEIDSDEGMVEDARGSSRRQKLPTPLPETDLFESEAKGEFTILARHVVTSHFFRLPQVFYSLSRM